MHLYFVFALTIVSQIYKLQAAVTVNTLAELDENEMKIVCHYLLHDTYQPGIRDYSPEVIDENKCTHIVYEDNVSYTNFTMTTTLHDGKETFYQRVPDLRKKGIHVLISFYDLEFFDIARLLNTVDERAGFVMAVVEFIERYNFDGFEFLWGCRPCLDDDPDEHSIDLVRQLSEAFKPRGWLLSVIVVPKDTEIDADLGIHKLLEYFEWIAIWMVNFSVSNTDHAAPLYSYPDNTNNQLTYNWSVNYFIEKGVPSHKIILYVITTTSTFHLKNAEENGLNAPTENRLKPKSFYTICDKTTQHELTVIHDTNRVGSYAYHNDVWYSYDDTEDVQRKAEYIIQMNLGGGAIYNLNSDDFQGQCDCGKNPLLTAMYRILRNVDESKIKNCT